MFKVVTTLSVAVEEDERLALALLDVVKLDVSHIILLVLRQAKKPKVVELVETPLL